LGVLRRALLSLGEIVPSLSRRVSNVGNAVLMSMVLLTVADITLRRLFSSPLAFSYELTQFMLLVYVFLVGAYAFSEQRTISIDAITTRYPPKVQAIVRIVVRLLGAGLWALIGWRSIDQGILLWNMGQISGILAMPYAPFIFLVAFGALFLALVLLIQSFELIVKVAK